jgi:hypothetical protein
MRTLQLLALAIVLAAAGPALGQGSDRFDQAVEGSSEPLPEGVPSGSPDAQLDAARSPDALEASAGDPDAQLTGAGRPIRAHAENPDALTTDAQDVSDLPSARVIDGNASARVIDGTPAPASLPPAPPLPEGCGQPTGDAGWSGCLSTVNDQLARARARLDSANAAYSRSITLHVPTGEARLAIVQERDAAQADVAALSSTLASQVSQAQQAGASSWVTAPYQPQTRSW